MVLELQNVTKLYKTGRGAEDISFSLAPGEVLGLLGPNGSGKTTTMKAIAGLLRPQQGTINVCGVDAIARHEQAMRYTSCLIEAPALYENMSVYRNLQMAARFYRGINENHIANVLHTVEMYRYQTDKVRTLSLGMRQRVGLALALLPGTPLLILDEPANGLDIEGMVLVREVILQAAANGAAVLVSSHLANEVQQCATKIAVLYDGKLLGISSTSEILHSFASVEDYFMYLVRGRRANMPAREAYQ